MTMKIAVIGSQGIGKTTICKKVDNILCEKIDWNKALPNYEIIYEQFREVIRDIPNSTKQTEEITLATYAKQLYLENLYTAQGKNILCDRSVLDTFIYYDDFNKVYTDFAGGYPCDFTSEEIFDINSNFDFAYINAKKHAMTTYYKIYLIEPSDREIEDDGFRMTDKKQQLKIHNDFLYHFNTRYSRPNNIVIVNQEEQDKVVEMIVNDFKEFTV